MGQNAWPGWDVQVLHDLGAPVSKTNIKFLDFWQVWEKSKARNNPLNLTAPAGSGTINSSGVQNYPDRQLAAQYTADNIKNYPTLYKMLKSDNVDGILGGHSGHSLNDLIAEINKWGSHNFATALGGGDPNKSITAPIAGVASTIETPFKDVASVFNWVGSNWDRILIVIFGAVLVIIALIMVFKAQSSNKGTFTFQRGEE